MPQQQVVEVTDDLADRFVAVYPAVIQVAQVAQSKLESAATRLNSDPELLAEVQERLAPDPEDGGADR